MTHQKPATPFNARHSRAVLGTALTELEPALMLPERLVPPDSWSGHIPFAFWLVAAAKPRRYVELGVHTGNSYCAVAQTIATYGLGTDCFGIDHWFGDEQAGLYGEDVYADLKAWHDPRYGHFSRLLRMSFEDGRAHVEDGSVDILHIDGLHTYEAVRTDFETWRSKMSERCIVLFHDTNVYHSDFGVWQYWREIQEQFPTFEFLHSNGLGVAYTGSAPLESMAPSVATLFSMSIQDETLAAARGYFARLGDSLICSVRLDETRRHGERIAGELTKAYCDLVAIDADRGLVAADREQLRQRALQWDRLAVRTGGAIGIELEHMSLALERLYNSDNPEARRDRGILKQQLAELIRTGTLDPRYKDLALRLAGRTVKRMKERLGARPPAPEDAAIAAIRASGLFDEHQYALSAEARAAGRDPLDHYLNVGEARRIAPSAGFDPDYYARRQPDVAASGFGLLRHYVLFGRDENRQPLPPARRMNLPVLKDNARPRLLLVLPSAERSDAVVTAWNIARAVRDSHDVIAFLHRGGPLKGAFASICAAVVDMPEEPDLHRIDRIGVMSQLTQELKPAFAVVASVESREYVRALVAAEIGVVQLVQDFASAVRPAGNVYDFLPWAHRLVFPSSLVADSYRREHPYLSRRRFDILSPVATDNPQTEARPFGTADHDETVRKRLRPVSHEQDFLVLGVGQVEAKNGVDLFVALAAAAGATSPGGRPLRFIWSGDGFAPQGNDPFSALLADQIEHSGVKDRLSIIDAVEEDGELFRQANVLALTARQDALSLAAARAAKAGVPVLCFNQANSLAEFAAENAVIPYLDTAAMVRALHTLADDEALCQTRATAGSALAQERFDVESYARNVMRLGEEAAEMAHAIEADRRSIEANRQAFSRTVFEGTSPQDDYPQDPLHAYLLRWRITRSIQAPSPIGLRRPQVGFNPLIYAEDRMPADQQGDALVDWLANGRPEGRWTHRVINLTAAKPKTAAPATLLHGHFFYADLADDFLLRLGRNNSRIDLVLTVPDEARAETVREALARHPVKGHVDITIVGNTGRDIGPFLSGLDADRLSRYDIVGHVHSKKSPHVEAVTGDQWRNFLWEHVIGGQTPAADICLAAMVDDPKLGLVFPEDANLHGWDANRAIAEPLAQRLGRKAPLPNAFEWPIGTMFWARREALQPLFALGLGWQDYPKEPLPGDGTLLHALERLIPFSVEQAGFGYATSHLEEVQR